MCEGDPGSFTNPALPAAIAPKQPPRKAEIEMPRLENPDLQVTGLESKHPVPVTRLKTSVTWAKSTKVVTLTVKPLVLGHNL